MQGGSCLLLLALLAVVALSTADVTNRNIVKGRSGEATVIPAPNTLFTGTYTQARRCNCFSLTDALLSLSHFLCPV